jgi:hypothetical protein
MPHRQSSVDDQGLDGSGSSPPSPAAAAAGLAFPWWRPVAREEAVASTLGALGWP